MAQKQPLDFSRQKTFAFINHIEVLMTVFIVFVAGFMARGISL
jgi:hypothetical protein